MPRPMGHIRILLSARVLFDLEEADTIFKEKGAQEYADYMRARGKYEKDFIPELGGRALAKGPLWDFAVAALALNKPGEASVVEIGLLCKDTGETVLPIFRNLDMKWPGGIDGIEYRMVMAGNKLDMSNHQAFGTDLLLTRNADDVQLAVNNNIAAAVVNFPPSGTKYTHKPGKALHICVDGDAVAVGSSAELVFRQLGLEKYRNNEVDNFDEAMEAGPFTAFLAKVSALNAKFAAPEQPIKISLLTARGNDAAAHIITAAEKLGIDFNGGLYFMGGSSKASVLKEQKPDLFFDDQMVHLQESLLHCPTGLVAYPKNSPMDLFLREKETITQKKSPADKPAAAKTARKALSQKGPTL